MRRLGVALALAAIVPVGMRAADALTGATARRAVSASPRATFELAPNLRLREIGDGVFVIAHTLSFLSNALLVEMPDGTLVMAGTPCDAEATRTVLRWLEQRWGRRSIVAINTGYHVDNLGGNEALLAAGIPVYGSDLTVKLLRERGESMRQLTLKLIGGPESPAYRAHASIKYLPPDHVFPVNDGLTLTFGGEQVRVIYPGPTQAPDKVVVYFPGRRLLFGGCAVVGARRLGNLAEADLPSWLAAIRKLRELPLDVVVPAHSETLDASNLANTEALLRPRLALRASSRF